jgi:hypothetical protein
MMVNIPEAKSQPSRPPSWMARSPRLLIRGLPSSSPDPGFHRRLAAQTYRFLQLSPQVEHWALLVVTPHSRLNLGPTQALKLFLEQQVVRLSLEELSQEPNLDPLLNLLTRADDLIRGVGSARHWSLTAPS